MQEYLNNSKMPFLLKEKFVFLSLLISNLNYVLYNSMDVSNSLKSGLRIAGVILLIFSSLLTKKGISVRNVDFVWLFLLFISLMSLNINNNFFNFIYIILVLSISKEIGKGKLIKYNYYIMVISIFLVFILLRVGVLNNVTYSIAGRTRNTFGFSNVNAFSNVVYSLYLMIFLYKKKISKKTILVLVITMYLIYTYTDTRTMIVSFLIFLIINILLKKIFKSKKGFHKNLFLKILLTFIVSIPILSSILAPLILRSFPHVDMLTSYRLSVFSNYINENGIINYVFGGTQVPDVDNGYLVIFFNTGIMFFIFLLYLILKALIKLVDLKDYRSIAFIVSFMYFSASEALIVRPELSASIVFWIIVYDTLMVNITNNKNVETQKNTE